MTDSSLATRPTTTLPSQDEMPTNTGASDSGEDDLGPTLPHSAAKARNSAALAGPAVPSFQDLELKQGMCLPLANSYNVRG